MQQAAVNKNWTPEAINQMLDQSRTAVVRALLAIYNRQTEDEKSTQDTKHHNGIGFNGVDAKILSSIAEWVKAGKPITPKQFDIVNRKIRKYAGQLARIANGAI